jgi:hypothetical protein
MRLLLEHNDAFSPEDVQVILRAFDDTLSALNLTDRERPLRMTVAKLIIEFARQGERDPDRLRHLVVKTLGAVSQHSRPNTSNVVGREADPGA